MRVLLATDGSSDANAATDWLPHLPFPADRELMVVTVVAAPARRWPGTPDSGQDTAAMRIRQARRLADETASRLLTGRTSVGRVVEGDPEAEIVASASDWGADVVVLGERGLGPIKGFFLASVSLGVVRNAPCPVLVCKGLPREVRRVTIALDGSPHARQALAWFARLPLAPTVRVRLVGVVEAEDDLSTTARERRAQLESELGAAARTLPTRVADGDVTLASGAPAARIVEEAERHASDLVVVGARGVGAAARLFLGSVSESVLRQARCPVLVVRHAAAPRA